MELCGETESIKPREPSLRVASRSGYGVVFIVVLLLVIFITNVPIRGLWSVIVVLLVLMATILLALLGWWDDILDAMAHSHVYINAFGYLAISLPLLVFWLVVSHRRNQVARARRNLIVRART